jgi:phage host-nuclease inhibitor protein Gam
MAKAKKTAAPWACQSRAQAQESIRALGDVQRELTRIQTDVNDQIAALTAERAGEIAALQTRAETLTAGIAAWCDANRAELCAGGGKTANLVTGEITWRQRPPSVSVRAADKVLATLKALGLARFVRVKEEVNKDAILADPAAVAGVAGLTVITGVEDICITPFEIEVTS